MRSLRTVRGQQCVQKTQVDTVPNDTYHSHTQQQCRAMPITGIMPPQDSTNTDDDAFKPAHTATLQLTIRFSSLVDSAQYSSDPSPATRARRLGRLGVLVDRDPKSFPVLSRDPSQALRSAYDTEAKLANYYQSYITAADTLAVPPELPEYVFLTELA